MKRVTRVKKKVKRGFWGWFWLLFKWVMVLGLVVGLSGVFIGISTFSHYASSTPPLDLEKLGNPEPSKVYDSNGELLAEVGPEPRIETTIDKIPIDFINALIAVEDARFFYHRGLDPIRIGKAAITSVMGGFGEEGGSTLTQQLVKLSFLDPDEMSLSRKSKEAVLAWSLEQAYSKDEILTAYINKVYMGDGVYGVETGAQHYYGKPLKDLEVHQLALLAGIPQSPSFLTPYYYPEEAKERRDTVLYRMYRIGVITEEELDRYQEIPIMDGVVEEGREIFKSVEPQHQEYIDQVIRQVREEVGIDLLQTQVSIYTTLEPKKQEALNEVIYTDNYFNWTGERLEATVAVINNQTGHVVALAGGNANTKEVGVQDGFSYPVDGVFQPGSVSKPLLAYAPALELLNKNMSDTIIDEPYYYTNGMQVFNYDFQHLGKMTLTKALVGSRNTTALALQKEVGTEKAFEFANSLGLNIPEDKYLESGAIGGINVPMVDLAAAYSTISNYGVRNQTTYIKEVKDGNNVKIWEPKAPTRVMREDKAKQLVHALKETVQDQNLGFGRWANVEGYDIYGKTGTNNYGSDEALGSSNLAPSVAFAGGTPDVTIAIYIEGETRDRGLVYPDEQNLPSKVFNKVLPLVSTDKSKFKQ